MAAMSNRTPKAAAPARRRGRPSLEDVFVAAVARDYAHARVRGGRPVEYVARLRGATVHKARNWINLARARGFLVGKSIPGKATGKLSAAAKKMLENLAREKRYDD